MPVTTCKLVFIYLLVVTSFTETTKASSFGKWEIIQIKKKPKPRSTETSQEEALCYSHQKSFIPFFQKGYLRGLRASHFIFEVNVKHSLSYQYLPLNKYSKEVIMLMYFHTAIHNACICTMLARGGGKRERK